VPRKIYWSDRLGMLVMADVPNSWGEPDAEMRRETEHALRQMIRRDFNHPSIFRLGAIQRDVGPVHQTRRSTGVSPRNAGMGGFDLSAGQELDPTRLVEDNSPCNYDHVETDINSWHAYLPGWEWKIISGR
jgi:hypothetical protein